MLTDQPLAFPPIKPAELPADLTQAELLREALVSAGNVLAFSANDWGKNSREAWLYGILLGWDDEDDPHDTSMASLAAKHGWSEADVARLRRLHAAVAAAAAKPEVPDGR